MHKYGFVYIWYDRKHKRYYVGCRWGNIDDGYVCSSDWMRNAHRKRPEDFKRRIIRSNIPSQEETFNEEFKYLSLMKDHELGTRYYNMMKQNKFHWTLQPRKEEIRKRLSESRKGRHFYPENEFKKGERRSPGTEFKKGIVPHNKGKTLEEVVGVVYAAELRQAKSDKYKGKSFSVSTQFSKGQMSGTNNANARAISTPYGKYDTIVDAARKLNISKYTIMHRLRSKTFDDWTYSDEDSVLDTGADCSA